VPFYWTLITVFRSLFFFGNFFRATFSCGLLRKLPANGFLLYQRASCLLLLEINYAHYTEKGMEEQGRQRKGEEGRNK
jgi:hypothetical protein